MHYNTKLCQCQSNSVKLKITVTTLQGRDWYINKSVKFHHDSRDGGRQNLGQWQMTVCFNAIS